jgi:3-oxoacyl-[acyl-carrier-protein] synthase III
MRVAAVKVALGSRRVGNEEILDLVRQHSASTFSGDLGRAVRGIGVLLRRTGAESRCWLAAGETAIGLTVSAVAEALREAGCDERDIDLLVYTGIDRGFVEPANAYFVAHALGMDRAHCFDVVDACNGWSRGAQLVDALFRAGTYRRALLVSSEFPLFEDGPIYPDLFTLRTPDDVGRSFAGFTVGEAAAATVLAADPGSEWAFRFASRADLVDLCTVPLPGYARYSAASDYVPPNGLMRFSSDGARMFHESREEITKLFLDLPIAIGDVAAIIPHAATARDWLEGAAGLGVDQLIYNIYPRCGNLASASVPAAIALAEAEGRIRRGDRLVCLTGSAGMSFAAYCFVY